MKNLIFINGTMGVGKTATCQKLKELLPKCVFLDGDWCWDMSPFVVNDETKEMVLNNISYLLNNFFSCSEYENIIFCWVMHEESIINDVLGKISKEYSLHKFSLICSEDILKQRLNKDIKNGIRKPDIIERSLPRLKNYIDMNTVKIDVSNLTSLQSSEIIYKNIFAQLT